MSLEESRERVRISACHASIRHFERLARPRADAVGYGKGRRLADIVKQDAHGQRRCGVIETVEHHECVGPDVALGMKLRWLLDALHGRDFGQDLLKQTTRIEQLEARACAAFRQDTDQFVTYTFRRYPEYEGREASHGGEGFALDVEAEPRGESHGADEPEVVFLKPDHGIADRADHMILQVGFPADVVKLLAREGVEEQAVDGEVAAQCVFARAGLEAHTLGAAAVVVVEIAAESGNFDRGVFRSNEYHAELRADQSRTGKQGDDLVGMGVGGDIVVLRVAAQQEVPHAAPDQQGLVPVLTEPPDDMIRQVLGCHQPSSTIKRFDANHKKFGSPASARGPVPGVVQ